MNNKISCRSCSLSAKYGAGCVFHGTSRLQLHRKMRVTDLILCSYGSRALWSQELDHNGDVLGRVNSWKALPSWALFCTPDLSKVTSLIHL